MRLRPSPAAPSSATQRAIARFPIIERLGTRVMKAKLLLLSALAGGVVIGTLGGLASDPVMLAPPEAAWRKLPRASVDAPPADAFVGSGTHDFRAAWLDGPAPDPRSFYRGYEMPAYQSLDLADYRVEQPVPLPRFESGIDDMEDWRDPVENAGAQDNAAAAQSAARDAIAAERATAEGPPPAETDAAAGADRAS